MGMAASQARLLCLTARMHDIEFQAQAIQHEKIQLSTQSDEAYKKYNEALDAETLTLQTSQGLITATFNSLCSKDAATNPNSRIALLNSKGQLIVPDDVDQGYHEFIENSDIDPKDGYNFALYMMGINPDEDPIRQMELAVYQANEEKNANGTALTEKYDSAMEVLKNLSNKYGNNGEPLNIYDTSILPDFKEMAPEDRAKYTGAIRQFKEQLYTRNSEEIFNCLTNDKQKFNENHFNYYVSVFNQIQTAGDCVSIEDYSDPIGGGSVANNEEWLQQMVREGYITIANVDTDSKTGETNLNTTSPSSDSKIGYTSTTSIDKKALAKAEAEYEHTLKQIDKKDKQYDMTLSKLETEREALKTEYDQVKKVAQDNVDRTFGIFS